MERRTALIFSTAAAVAIAAAGFGYAANNLLTKPSQDQVGKLAAVLPAAPAPRPVQIVYDEVPVEVPPAASGTLTSPAVSGQDATEVTPQPATQSVTPGAAPAPAKPSANTTTTTTAPTRPASGDNNVSPQPTETHTTETTQPDDHALDD